MPMEIVYGLLPVYDSECMCGVQSMILHIFTCSPCIKCMETDYVFIFLCLLWHSLRQTFHVSSSYLILNRPAYVELLVSEPMRTAVGPFFFVCGSVCLKLLFPIHVVCCLLIPFQIMFQLIRCGNHCTHTHRYKQYLPFNTNIFIRHFFFLALPIFRLFLFVSHNGGEA